MYFIRGLRVERVRHFCTGEPAGWLPKLVVSRAVTDMMGHDCFVGWICLTWRGLRHY